jgi:hypothetical protein
MLEGVGWLLMLIMKTMIKMTMKLMMERMIKEIDIRLRVRAQKTARMTLKRNPTSAGSLSVFFLSFLVFHA